MPDRLTDSDRKALAAIQEIVNPHDRTFTCTELGERLFGTNYRNRQCYARPGGKVAKRLMRMGYVAETVRGYGRRRRSCYCPTGKAVPEVEKPDA